MKFSSKEQHLLLIISVVIGLYDFFSIPFTSFIVTCIFAGILYYLTSSMYFVALCALVPQFIRLLNFVMNKKESFVATDPQQVMNAVRKQLENQGNKELFTNAAEVSQRVQELRNNKVKPVESTAGLVDISVPSSEIPIEGNPSTPSFMEQFQNGTSVDTNTRIYTGGQDTIISNERPQPRNSVLVEKFDMDGLGNALLPTTNGRPQNLRGMEMNPNA